MLKDLIRSWKTCIKRWGIFRDIETIKESNGNARNKKFSSRDENALNRSIEGLYTAKESKRKNHGTYKLANKKYMN